MKKSIIALAVLATMAAQADNTTLYGSVRMGYTFQYDKIDDDNKTSSSKFGDEGSRFGIKGEESLGNGMAAFYNYENRVGKGVATTDKLYAGVKGGFGSLSFGKQNMPVDDLGNYSDPFNVLGLDRPEGAPVVTSSDSSVVYWTPSMDGFSAGVGLEANGKGGEHNHVDKVSAAAKYEANGFFAGVGYSEINNDAETDTYSFGLGYGDDVFEIGLLGDYYKDAGEDGYVWTRLGGKYNVTPADSLYAGYATLVDLDDTDTITEDWQAAIGYQHNFSKRTRMWTEYNFQDKGEDNGDTNQLSIGLRTDF